MTPESVILTASGTFCNIQCNIEKIRCLSSYHLIKIIHSE